MDEGQQYSWVFKAVLGVAAVFVLYSLYDYQGVWGPLEIALFALILVAVVSALYLLHRLIQ